MTREEKLQQAVNNFSEAHKYEEGLDFLSMGMAFEEGVEWADKNPDISSLWHDASEEPEGVNCKILCQDKYERFWSEKKIGIKLVYKDWNTYTEIEGVVRWAYIEDLLPKGGGQ